ncbi:hypothetical protein CEV32_1091 [Brucella rhizosphaerae]|uniref:Uncharacterized protein n=1 Tax=Brucella rhizosphaerae TaxID=571254 RepID=A0A256FE18_9HYPH|nr:hypothetical protein CEV32_1091 [Brucella rhizosphaerae]
MSDSLQLQARGRNFYGVECSTGRFILPWSIYRGIGPFDSSAAGRFVAAFS